MVNSITLFFRWDSLQPDRRQWKPSNPLIEPLDVTIAIDVPLEHQYVYNAEAIINAQVTNQTVEEPILTVKGMRYCIDQFENEMTDKPQEEELPNDEDLSTDEWEVLE